MIKLLNGLLIFFVLMFVCCLWICCIKPQKNPNVSKNGEIKQYGDFEIKIIDGCEYIEFDNINDGLGYDGRVYSLTHKGNCKNPIHMYNSTK